MLAWEEGMPMAMIVGVVSQKGGVGKSTLARLIAGEFAAQDWQVKIADLDVSQATSFHWRRRRLQRSLEPDISVEQYGRVDQALKIAEQYDLLVLDGAPHATQTTLQIAQASNLVVIPTGLAIDDLQPAVRLAHELVTHLPRQRLVFALCRVGASSTEIEEARNYLREAGYTVLQGELPEKAAYRRASDEGRTVTETHFTSLNRRAEALAQSVVNALASLTTRQPKRQRRKRHG
jgi:chromosome partitioning protein